MAGATSRYHLATQQGIKRAGVKNAMVIALDAATKANAESKGLIAHEMHVEVRSRCCRGVSRAPSTRHSPC